MACLVFFGFFFKFSQNIEVHIPHVSLLMSENPARPQSGATSGGTVAMMVAVPAITASASGMNHWLFTKQQTSDPDSPPVRVRVFRCHAGPSGLLGHVGKFGFR